MDDLPTDPQVLQARLTKAREEFRKLTNKLANQSVQLVLANSALDQAVQIMGGSAPDTLMDHPAVRMAFDHTLVASQAATHRLKAEYRLDLIRSCEKLIRSSSVNGRPEEVERLLSMLRSEITEEDRERVREPV